MLRHANAIGLVAGGIGGAGVSMIGAAYTLAADSTASDVGPFITGGGAITSAGVLALVAVKLTRGELVARDPARVEAALQALAKDYRDDHRETGEQWAQLTAERNRTNEIVERALTALARREGTQ